MRFGPVPLVIAILFIGFSCAGAGAADLAPLKTEYFEGTDSEGKSIRNKLWKTSRGDQMLMTHQEDDIVGNGSFSEISDMVFYRGQKLLLLSRFEGKRSLSFYPVADAHVLQSDADGDGYYERLSIWSADGKFFETFSIGRDGKLTVDTEAYQREQQQVLKRVEKEMKERFGEK